MFFKKRRRRYQELNPDEVFMDSSNLPSFDTQQFEDRIEKAISKKTLYVSLVLTIVIILLFSFRVFSLQLVKGKYYADRSANNSLNFTPIFPERGNLTDRNGVELAWNDSGRKYTTLEGFGHVLGYVGYPNEEEMTTGKYHPKEFVGRDGLEKVLNDQLAGSKGVKIEEVTAIGRVASDHIVEQPKSGKNIKLSVDSRVQGKLYELIRELAGDRGFVGGGGVIMDIETGEILALTNFPSYDSNIISAGQDAKKIGEYFSDKRHPLLNRIVSGLYVPGSVFKPFMAAAALREKIISPEKIIVSTGALSIVNPYDSTKKSVFKDWKAHGPVDMRRALAVSSDVYFYVIGGGFGGQKGLGIANIKKYSELFGLSKKTGINLPGEEEGEIPDPKWKAKNFDGEPWRIGDTYHTVIGQYGVWITPLQIARGIAGIASGGKLVKPTLVKLEPGQKITKTVLPFADRDLEVVLAGMRQAVIEGTASALNVSSVKVAAKTGTAELGVSKDRVNSWIVGFFPYDKPRYVFTVVMESGHVSNLVGGVFVMRQLLDWMAINTPEYLTSSK